MLVDMGWTSTSAQGAGKGYDEILSHPHLMIKSLKQETGEIVYKESGTSGEGSGTSDVGVGTVLTVASYHACASAHQYEKLYVEKDGKIVGSWKRCPVH